VLTGFCVPEEESLMKVNRRLSVVVIGAFASVAIAACGSSGDSSTSTGSSGSSTAAASSSGKKDPGSRTIGVIPSTSSSENLAVWIAQTKAAAAPFGWKVQVCNGNGNPATMESCVSSLVTQKVDAIVTMALGGPEIPNGFKQAKAAGIPMIAEGTSVNPGFEKIYNGVFADDIPAMGKITGTWITKNKPSDPVVGLDVSQNYGGHGYIVGVKAGLASGSPPMKYTDLRDTNLADIVNSMKSTGQAVVRAHPGPLTYVTFNDIDSSLYWADFQKAGRDKDVTMITRYDDPSTVKIMRTGANVLVNNSKDWQHVFDMMTALAALWTSKTPLPPASETTNTPGGGVYSIKDFPPPPAIRQFPFPPALKNQIAIWGKTYNLKSSSLTAP
jgi:ABC-type sugar transport system substrate-binding protein